MKLKYWISFFLFIILTPFITYLTWPSEVWQPHPQELQMSIIGLCIMWFFVGVTYFGGLHAVIKDKK